MNQCSSIWLKHHPAGSCKGCKTSSWIKTGLHIVAPEHNAQCKECHCWYQGIRVFSEDFPMQGPLEGQTWQQCGAWIGYKNPCGSSTSGLARVNSPVPTEPKGYPISDCSCAVQWQSLSFAISFIFLTAQAVQGRGVCQALLQKELCQTLHHYAGREKVLQTAASTSAVDKREELAVVSLSTGEIRNFCSFSPARYLVFSLLSSRSLRVVPTYCLVVFVARPPLQLNSHGFLSDWEFSSRERWEMWPTSSYWKWRPSFLSHARISTRYNSGIQMPKSLCPGRISAYQVYWWTVDKPPSLPR